jgi:sec-independent protein translocase protein TatA
MLLQLPLLGIIGMQEILIIAVVVLVLFGGKKIPELMRGLGSGVKSFKEGMKDGMPDEDEDTKKDALQKTEKKDDEK